MTVDTEPAPRDADSQAPAVTDKSQESVNRTHSLSGMRCPDPAAHGTKDTTLQDRASAAAVKKRDSAQEPNLQDASHNILGPDGKLSTASAATSLKHARAQDLPAFPIVGIDTRTSADTAANLAFAHQHSPEYWKPEHSAVAGKAALLANSYKMTPQWEPETSQEGSRAAVRAHVRKSKDNQAAWKPTSTADGHSAANLAMKRKGSVRQSQDNTPEDAGRHKAMSLASAVSSAGRKRAHSNPVPPTVASDNVKPSNPALNAATLAHRPSMKAEAPRRKNSNRPGSEAMEAARIQHSRVSREMYTERPPVALEVEEQNHQNALRASALSMAKGMYDTQERIRLDAAAAKTATSQGKTAATAATHDKKRYSSEADIKEQAKRYLHVQEAAQKLAAERLAKIGKDENAAFRSYWGYSDRPKSKLLTRTRRDRAASNPEPSESDDEIQSHRIRSQMSHLNKSLAEVDAKREDDRRKLLAAAERKVHEQMQGIDKKVFNETGKMSPAMIEEWDARARAKAAANSEARMANHGKVHIGGDVYLDQSEIDAIAAARVQPTLDEITERSEKQRAKEEEERLDREEKKRQTQIEKERAAELAAEEKKAKDEEKKLLKSRNTEEQQAAREAKEAEKAREAEEKRLQKKEKRRSMFFLIPKSAQSPRDTEQVVSNEQPLETPTDERDPEGLYTSPRQISDSTRRESANTDSAEVSSPVSSPTSPTGRTGFKSFLDKFKRRTKRGSSAGEHDSAQPGFIGGAAYRSSPSHSHSNSRAQSPHVTPAMHPAHPNRSYSDVSSLESQQERGRDKGADRGNSHASGSGTAGTDHEEARDAFDESLAPPPTFTSVEAEAQRKGSPTRESRFREIGL